MNGIDRRFVIMMMWWCWWSLDIAFCVHQTLIWLAWCVQINCWRIWVAASFHTLCSYLETIVIIAVDCAPKRPLERGFLLSGPNSILCWRWRYIRLKIFPGNQRAKIMSNYIYHAERKCGEEIETIFQGGWPVPYFIFEIFYVSWYDGRAIYSRAPCLWNVLFPY